MLECFKHVLILPSSGSTSKQDEAGGSVTSNCANTFFGRAVLLVGQNDDTTGHLQNIFAQSVPPTLSSLVSAETFCLCTGYCYHYCPFIGGIPIAMHTVLSVALAVSAQ